MTDTKSRVLGTIMGLACGDALGAPVEFTNQSALIAKYGDEGITELEESYGVHGAYTDDTQMSLATADGIIAARAWEETPGARKVDPSPFIYIEYIKWFIGQNDSKNRRGPGGTCMGALGGGVAGSVGLPINDSKGCGGVMRVAPVGLVYNTDAEAWLHGNNSAALTHSHPGGWLPSGFLAVMISRILRSELSPAGALKEAFDTGMGLLEGVAKGTKRDHFAGLMVQARNLARQTKWSDEMAMRKLGAGWCGDEALALAVFIAFRYPTDLRQAVQKAVLYSGDRDSVGSIAGALMGALLGAEAIPESWVANVEDRAGLEHTADLLFEARRG
jgi:ADP-ribosylglycohydrolase